MICCDRCFKKQGTYTPLYRVGWSMEESLGTWFVCERCYIDFCKMIKNFMTNIEEE